MYKIQYYRLIFVFLVAFLCKNNSLSFDWEWQNPLPQGNTLRSVYFLNSDTGYAVGFGGVILNTVDGGETWEVKHTDFYDAFNGIIFTDVNHGFLIQSQGPIFKTVDAGKTWFTNNEGSIDILNDITFTSKTTGYAVGWGGNIIKTIDAGTTWTEQSSGTQRSLSKVFFVDSLFGVTVGEYGTTLKTTDGGKHWEKMYIADYLDFKSVIFLDHNTGYVISSNKLFKTTNGGYSWNILFQSADYFSSMNFINKNIGFLANYKGIIYKTTNGGGSWTMVKDNQLSVYHNIYSINCPNDTTIYAVAANGLIFKSVDQGATWNTITKGTIKYFRDICFTGQNNGHAVGDNGIIYNTSDGGHVWNSIDKPTVSRLNAVFFINADTGYVAGEDGKILKSTDNGQSWNNLTFNTSHTYNNLYFTSKDTGYAVGGNGIIIKTTDGGTNWDIKYSDNTFQLNCISFVNDSLGFAVGTGGKILFTEDKGETWIEQISGTTKRLNSIHFYNDTIAYVAAESSLILKTVNRGQSWSTKNLGSGYELLDIHIVDDYFGYCVGKSGMIYTTMDGGTSWSRNRYDMKSTLDINAVCSNDSHDIYIAGSGGHILNFTCNEVKENTYKYDSSSVVLTSTDMVFTVPEMEEATEYIWYLPDGSEKMSTENNISISLDSSFLNKQIKIRGKNTCSASRWFSMPIKEVDYIIQNIQATACDSFVSPSGKQIWYESGTYEDAIINESSYDSIYIINLLISKTTYDTIMIDTIGSYTSPSEKYIWTTSGTYQDTIPNATGCDSIITINLTIGTGCSLLKINFDIYNLTCSGSCNGTIVANASGGESPYTYHWENGGNKMYLFNICEGEYKLTVTDNNGCVIDSIATVTGPDPIEIETIVQDITCNGYADGSVSTTVYGGIKPYSYKWKHGELTKDISSLSAGTYYLTVTDSNRCSLETTVEIAEPDSLNIELKKEDVTCGGVPDGSISIKATGGSLPYKYLWNTGDTGQHITNIGGGIFECTIYDLNGCTKHRQIEVFEPNSIVISPNVTNPTCNENNDGAIEVSVSGGVAPYEYSWSNGNNTESLVNIHNGEYIIKVTDSTNCENQLTIKLDALNKTEITGTLSYSKGNVKKGDANVILFDGTKIPYTEIKRAQIDSNGKFIFTDLISGQYIVYASLIDHSDQEYKGIMKSYYQQTYKWKDADLLELSCGQSLTINLNMYENPSATNKNGKASGKINCNIDTVLFGGQYGLNTIVITADQWTKEPTYFTDTDSLGKYSFDHLAPGDYYLYIDIPGIEQKTTYEFTINETLTEYTDLDFNVDLLSGFDIIAINDITVVTNIMKNKDYIEIFPNPAYDNVNIAFSEKKEVLEISLFSQNGIKVKSVSLNNFSEKEYVFDISEIPQGNYLLMISADNHIEYKKVVIK